MKLTVAMLDAIRIALSEIQAGEGPQGIYGEEAIKVNENIDKAKEWVLDELERRSSKKKSTK